MDILLGWMIRILVAFSAAVPFLSQLHLCSYDSWQPGKKIKFLIVGYNGARNTGADARVVAIVKQIKELFGSTDIEITVMTLSTETLQGYFDKDVKLLQFSSLFPLPLFKACCTHHIAVISEGSTLKSTFANALTLFFCEASGIMTSQHKPCIAYGSEVGQMEPALRKVAQDLCKETYFITRTQESQRELEKLHLSGHVGTDTAWIYDGKISQKESIALLKAQGWDGQKKLIGAAVINPFCWPVRTSAGRWFKGKITGDMSGCYDKWYFFSESEERTQAFENYLTHIADALNRYQKQEDCFIVVIGMERLDEEACMRLKRKLHSGCAVFLAKNQPASVMSGILQRLHMLVTSRYHASVLSMPAGIPIIAVSMDERLDSIFRELSLQDRYLLHVDDVDLNERILTALCLAETEREEIHHRIEEEYKHYQEKLNAMGEFLKNYIRRSL